MEELAQMLLSTGGTPYLACDGAAMPDLKSVFASIGLLATPLFRGSLDPEVIEDGPWLVAAEKTKLAKALDLASSSRVGVCWVAENTGLDEMVRHLRGLNQAKLPNGSLCYFRHYDPDALAWLAERLDGEQAARLFGPARTLGFVSGFAAGATIEKPDALPSPQIGLITFSDGQMAAMRQRNDLKSRIAIRDFLRFSFPAELSGKSDRDLLHFIEARERVARNYSLSTERQIAMWAYGSIGLPQGELYEGALAAKIKSYA